MALEASAGNAGMIHSCAEEGRGVGVAAFARHQGREVGGGLAHNTQRLVVMAIHAIARHPDVLVAAHQEIGCADVAGIAFCRCRHVIRGLGFRADARAGGVAARAVFGGILENALDVALFALQCSVNVPEDEAGSGVVRGSFDAGCLGRCLLGCCPSFGCIGRECQGRDKTQRAGQHCFGEGSPCSSVAHYVPPILKTLAFQSIIARRG